METQINWESKKGIKAQLIVKYGSLLRFSRAKGVNYVALNNLLKDNDSQKALIHCLAQELQVPPEKIQHMLEN